MLRLPINHCRELLRASKNVQGLTKCKFSRLACNATNVSLRNNVLFSVHKHSRIPTIYVLRHQSTVDSTEKKTGANTQEATSTQQTENTVTSANVSEADKSFISEIPDAPIPPVEDTTSIVSEVLTATGEPTFSSLGLGGYGPVGLAQYCFEWIHIGLDMPWWATIAAVSIIVKIITIPPAISMTRNNAKMFNIMPEMVTLQSKMTEARQNGSQEEATLHAYELQTLLKKNNISVLPFTNLLLRGVLHLPIFMGLRGMANLPVESLKTGGLWWFTDLTATDPYYLLPALTSIGLYFVTASAAKSAAATSTNPMMLHMMRAIPFITFIFAINFPGAVLCYWVLTNCITIAQNEVLKLDKVKVYLNIPLPQKQTIPADILKKKNFREAFSESITNMKISKKVANTMRADEMQFVAAGKGSVKKTFKHNPLINLPVKSTTAMKK